MKKLILISVLTSLVLTFSSCKKEEIIVQKDFLSKKYIEKYGTEYADVYTYNSQDNLSFVDISLSNMDNSNYACKATINTNEDNKVLSIDIEYKNESYSDQKIEFVYENNKLTIHTISEVASGLLANIGRIEYIFDTEENIKSMHFYSMPSENDFNLELIAKREYSWDNGNNTSIKHTFYKPGGFLIDAIIMQDFEFDNMHNAEESIPFALKAYMCETTNNNNIIKETITYENGYQEFITYKYEYNENGYPVVKKAYQNETEIYKPLHFEYFTTDVLQVED